MFQAPPPSFAGPDVTSWRRDAYKVALIGPQSTPHAELLERAGYQIVSAKDGDAATVLFGHGEIVDVVVLDFESHGGRPPEAVLLFSRRTSAGAPVIAIVPPEKNEAYRRAFLAGARDVLPAPARGEDLLAAIDLLLEPRGLADIVEELRARGFDDDGESTVALGEAPSPDIRARVSLLESELQKKSEALDDALSRQRTGTATFRQQALDAITARDRALESRERVKQKLTHARRELKERDGQLRLTERACEELNQTLKEAATQRRTVENELLVLRARVEEFDLLLARETTPHPPVGGPSSEDTQSWSPDPLLGSGALDPELALQQRDADAEKIGEMEGIWARYQSGLKRIRDLESALEGRTDPGAPAAAVVDPAEALELREEDEERLQELERAHEERSSLLKRVALLEGQLRQQNSERRAQEAGVSGEVAITLEIALAEIDSEREAHAATLGTLDAIRLDRDTHRHRADDAERDAADALTELEELGPLTQELERMRRELFAEQASHRSTRERMATAAETDDHAKGNAKGNGSVTGSVEGSAKGSAKENVHDPEAGLADAGVGKADVDAGGSGEGGTPAQVWERADQLQFDLDRARAEVEISEKLRSEFADRLQKQETELTSLRVMVAALTGDRLETAKTPSAPGDETAAGASPSPSSAKGPSDFDIDI